MVRNHYKRSEQEGALGIITQVTHVRNKNSKIQERSLNVIKVISIQ